MDSAMSNLYRSYLTLKSNPKALVQVFVPKEAHYLPFKNGDRPAIQDFEEALEKAKKDGHISGTKLEQTEQGEGVKYTFFR
jgi:hypothetical protein